MRLARLASPLLALALASAFAPAARAQSPAPAANVAGTVDFVEGEVTIQRAGAAKAAPARGDAVREGDTVATGATGEVHFTMADGGYLALRPDTKVRIAQFRADGDKGDQSVLGVLEGSLRVVTGWIGKYNPGNYQVRTTFGTVGIRGTDHETLVRLRDDSEGEAGLYDRVYEGGTFIRSARGRVNVGPNRVGFLAAKERAAPRLLDRVPAFFRATRNERLVEGRHARIQGQLQKLREERRAKLKAAIAERIQQRREARDPKARDDDGKTPGK